MKHKISGHGIALICLAVLPFTAQAVRRPVKRAPEDWPIKTGYVAFGDSYAAGMGTGSTGVNSCRVGSNNFGRLLNQFTANPDVDYQEWQCSGDTTFGLNRQIDQWRSPQAADIATLSMGGNDLGFGKLVWECVIHPGNSLGRPKPPRPGCVTAKTKARNLMELSDGNGLQAKLRVAYSRILDKSTRDDFHLYVTSYPLFFNANTTRCDSTTFDFFFPQYAPGKGLNGIGGRIPLTTDLRSELNGLVEQLNTVIAAAVRDANQQQGREQVHFVDVNEKFNDNHHWCEEGVFEPMKNRQETWFFLRGWKDVPIPDSTLSPSQTAAEEQQHEENLIQQYISAGSIPMPDSATCEEALGTDPDPWASWMCNVAQYIAESPNSTMAQDYIAANDAIANGNVSDQHIDPFLSTRTVKTFHPRSPGMAAYRDSIIEAISVVQSAGSSTSGNCVFNITETMDCQDDADNLAALVYLYAPDGSEIYLPDNGSYYINDKSPWWISSPYGNLTIVGEHVNDYIQFSNGKYSWTSKTTTGPATCELIGPDWNPNGPSDCPANNNMWIDRMFQCQYPCSKSS